jgi:uncharacterized protein YdaU (DUF1376 family)
MANGAALPYYKRYPRDFLEGTIGMSFEEKGAYAIVLDLIYMRGGALPDDDRYIAGQLGASVKLWKKLRDRLISLGKLQCQDGFISNSRASELLETSAKFQDEQSKKAAKPRKNKAIRQPKSSQPEPEPEPIEATPSDEGVAGASAPPPDPDPQADDPPKAVSALDAHRIDTAFRQFVAAASRQPGWTVPKALNRQRRAALAGRIREHGLDGWGQVIERAERSRFLTGQGGGDRPFGLTLDWLCKPANLLKVLEGNYDDRPANPNTAAGPCAARPGPSGGRLDAFDRLAERLAGHAARPDAGGRVDPGPAGDGTIDAEYTRLTG